MAGYRTPLARVRGLGSVRSGTDHFWQQRLTAVANLFLLVFLIYTVLRVVGAPYEAVRAYFASPLVTVPALMLAIFVPFHMRIGMQVIIEDYVHAEGWKVVLIVLNTFFALLVSLTAIVALIKLSLGA